MAYNIERVPRTLTVCLLILMVATVSAESSSPMPSNPPSFPPVAPSAPSPPPPMFTLPALPYAYDALEPHFDNITMWLHHTRHHQALVSNLNAAVNAAPVLRTMTLAEINQAVGTEVIPPALATTVRNNAGGAWNHAFFWRMLAPADRSDITDITDDLREQIAETFGNLTAMQAAFNAAAAGRFGSGWAWLGVKEDGSLAITSTPNQDNPLQRVADVQMIPILGLDVWEHSYYIKYQNRRADFINAFWNVVNWQRVSTNYVAAKEGLVAPTM